MNADKLIQLLLADLNPRQEEVISGRFGLKKFNEPQTLAALGEKYKITRERIRQIESSALALLRGKIKENASATEVLNRAQKLLKSSGGVLHKDDLVSELKSMSDGITERHLSLLAEASGLFHEYKEDPNFFSFYYLDKTHLKTVVQFIEQFVKFLRPKKEEILNGKFEAHLQLFLKENGYEAEHAAQFLKISKKIHSNPYGDTGLAVWPEIKPQTIRDRIYLILKKKGAPLHFRVITKEINNVSFRSKPALVPTVHNELIKDNRFILVGRGIYALAEHGYEAGTAKEVIQRILKKEGALTLPNIVQAVQRERFFKENTIVANLQNKNIFKRLTDGRYHVRES